MKSLLYIAYGSNLDVAQMSRRCPDAVRVGKAILRNYELTFRSNYRGHGVANIEPCKGASVPVGIWAISGKDREALDRYEGAPYLYRGVNLQFDFHGQRLTGLCYIMNDGFEIAPPASWYFGTIAQGYEDFGFDLRTLEDAALNAQALAYREAL